MFGTLTGVDAVAFLKTVLEPGRLAVAGLVAAAPTTLPALCEATGQPRREVLATLASLLEAGIVERRGDAYALRPAALRDLARDLPQQQPPAREVLLGMTQQEQAILGRFFRGERLVEIPAQRSKRLIVLERLALEFEPGVHYAEAHVNDLLRRFHDDVAALRRYLVDEGFLDRESGRYWRSGGRV